MTPTYIILYKNGKITTSEEITQDMVNNFNKKKVKILFSQRNGVYKVLKITDENKAVCEKLKKD